MSRNYFPPETVMEDTDLLQEFRRDTTGTVCPSFSLLRTDTTCLGTKVSEEVGEKVTEK